MDKPRRAGDRTRVKNWGEHRSLSTSSPLSPCPIEKQTNLCVRGVNHVTSSSVALGRWTSEKNEPHYNTTNGKLRKNGEVKKKGKRKKRSCKRSSHLKPREHVERSAVLMGWGPAFTRQTPLLRPVPEDIPLWGRCTMYGGGAQCFQVPSSNRVIPSPSTPTGRPRT